MKTMTVQLSDIAKNSFILSAEYYVKVKVQCIGCKKTRDILAGEIKSGDQPMCDCGMPMVAVKASMHKKAKI